MDSNTVTRHDRKTLGLVSAKQSQSLFLFR